LWLKPILDRQAVRSAEMTDVAEFRRLQNAGEWREAEQLMERLEFADLENDSAADTDPIGAFYEAWGDAIVDTDPEQARSRYELALDNYRRYASWATSGSEGLARMQSVRAVERKLQT
jgi:hypothetical protein